MADARMKVPGPDHPISVTPDGKHVRVLWQGRVVADSTKALALKEASYPIVYYIPRADVDMSLLDRSAHHTYCPYKGEASYYSLAAEGGAAENAVWSYEDPYPAMETIRGHVAFYPDRVDHIEIGES
ncbi:MAG TPA: DUF427 domain-containing protein [Beijerinckiaceae bacterium]|nr:DUF427 domain-containing protein [Beijerinckiaceae bacterium]